MSSNLLKPLSFAVGAALIGSLALSQSSFAMTPLASGYLLAEAATTAPAAKPAATAPMAKPMAKKMEGKCGEGLCGMASIADSNGDGMVSAEEHAAHASKMFEMADTNHDGMLSKDEMADMRKSMREGKCGEGKCGAGMKGKDTMHHGAMHDDDAEDAAEHAKAPAKK